MSVINTGKAFANGEQLTADKLNQVIDQATFNAAEAVDGSTITLISGAMAVNDDGITEAKIENGAVTTNKIPDENITTAKIADSNVTKAKIENVNNMRVLGNTSGAAAAPQEVEVIDEASGIASNDNDTSIPTSAAVKSYVDGSSSFSTDGTDSQSTGYQVFPSGLKMAWGDAEVTNLGDTISFPTGVGFTQPPTVQMTYNTIASDTGYNAPVAGSVSTSGFIVRGSYAANSGFGARYLAIGH